ncbi:hypothetical protein AVEN_94687-1 [Araneus ventricosus]|uniref:Uncharacterized protein n=1 Tax=Araneus ventricosus TaxID=182803 RepID=A0A4Y2I734_ARAVE|nr:hypothetical protein AVEN_94687-1 [Araneus ventricosus]
MSVQRWFIDEALQNLSPSASAEVPVRCESHLVQMWEAPTEFSYYSDPEIARQAWLLLKCNHCDRLFLNGPSQMQNGFSCFGYLWVGGSTTSVAPIIKSSQELDRDRMKASEL